MDSEWINIQPELVSLMAQVREVAKKEEMRERIEQRIHEWLKPAHTAFVLSQPPNEPNPSILDIALSEDWRALLCSELFDKDSNGSLIEAACANIPNIAETWRKSRIGQLLDVVRRSKTYSGKEFPVDVLNLSSTIFRCTNCSLADCEYAGDVHTYPYTLIHACNYLESDSPQRREFILQLDRDDERCIVEALRYAGLWSGLSHIDFDDAAHEHMLSLLDALGWSRNTSVDEMEERQPWKKAMYLCKPHHCGQERITWFSKMSGQDLAAARKHEDARRTSTAFHCPWCYMHGFDPGLPLASHIAHCFAIQRPYPSGLKEHAEKIHISPGDLQSLINEKNVLLDV
ncbi:hypothetical protein MD484_g7150, partial [Candolleomyces efflorescens]